MALTYRISRNEHGEKYIECLVCRFYSYHYGDIIHKYCGNCKQFHDAMMMQQRIAEMSEERRQTVAVDFDGVIHWYRKGWQDGAIYDEPMPEAFSSLIQLTAEYAVFIHSSRPARQIVDWINEKQPVLTAVMIPDEMMFWNGQANRSVIGVTNRKLPAVAYIDDRGLHFTTWAAALEGLAERKEKGLL